MRPDDNWRETRLLAEDLDVLLGLPKNVTEDYLKILENLIIHRFVEKIADEEDFRGKDYQIELPYIGSLIVSISENSKISTDFVVRNSFYRKLKSACFSKTSPLVDQCADILGRDLAQKFEEGTINDE